MPVTTTTTVTGSTADFMVTASGSGFGVFSSYTAFASEATTYTASSTTGTGSVSLSLDTSFGSLVLSGSDTIGYQDGTYVSVESESLSFVVGSDTLTLATVGGADLNVGSAGLVADLNNFFSSVLSVDSVVSLPDSVAAAVSSALLTVLTKDGVVSGSTTTTETTHGATISLTNLS